MQHGILDLQGFVYFELDRLARNLLQPRRGKFVSISYLEPLHFESL